MPSGWVLAGELYEFPPGTPPTIYTYTPPRWINLGEITSLAVTASSANIVAERIDVQPIERFFGPLPTAEEGLAGVGGLGARGERMAYNYHPTIDCKNVLSVRLGPEYPNRVLIPTNGSVRKDGACVMGRGVAKQFKDKYGGIDFQLGALIKEYGSKVQLIVGRIYAFPVKHDWADAADLELIRTSCRQLMELVERDCKEGRWYLPTPGCGNGQLDFATVLPVLLEEFNRPEGVRVTLIERTYERYELLGSALRSAMRGNSASAEEVQQTIGVLPVEFDDDTEPPF